MRIMFDDPDKVPAQWLGERTRSPPPATAMTPTTRASEN